MDGTHTDIAELGQTGHTDITGLGGTGVLVVNDEYDQERMALPAEREDGILLVGTGRGPVWGIMTRTMKERPGERDQQGSRQPDKFGRSGHLEGTSDSQVRTALQGLWMVPAPEAGGGRAMVLYPFNTYNNQKHMLRRRGSLQATKHHTQDIGIIGQVSAGPRGKQDSETSCKLRLSSGSTGKSIMLELEHYTKLATILQEKRHIRLNMMPSHIIIF